MKTKLIATTAIAALALPAVAGAEKPAKPAKAPKTQTTKTHGFSLAGTKAQGLAVTDGKLTAPFTLDPKSANRWARTFLQLTKSDVRGDKTAELGTAGDAVIVKYVGLSSTDALQPTDRVK